MVKLIKIKNLKKFMSCLTALPARPPSLVPTATTLWDTVRPVLRGQPRGQAKLAA